MAGRASEDEMEIKEMEGRNSRAESMEAERTRGMWRVINAGWVRR